MLHVFSKQRHEFPPPPSQGKLGAIDASCLPLPSFNCSFSQSISRSHSHSPFSVLPLLVVATQITLCKEKERKCESAGQTYFIHTHTHTPSTLSLHTHISLARTHTPPFLLYSAPGAVPAHLSLFQDVPTCISTDLSPLPPLCSSAPCHLSHEWRLFAIGSFTEAEKQTETKTETSSIPQRQSMQSYAVCLPSSLSSSSSPLLTI